MEGLLVLPKDIRIVPTSDLPESMRSQIAGGDDGYALARPNARIPSKFIDRQAWSLLEQFKEPKTVVDAVLQYSRAQRAKPSKVFDDAFPLIESLYQTRLLVEADSEDASAITPSIEADAVVGGCTILRNVQTLPDTELYQVRTSAGDLAALKIERPGAPAHAAASLTHETRILTSLGVNPAVPRLFDSGVYEGRPYLMLEWCEGDHAAAAAGRVRAGSHPEKIEALCSAVLEAYAQLHEGGVLHGDVHPRNIVVASNGRPTILDFGLACSESLPAPARGGVGSFFEPEYARAVVAGVRSPAVTAAGEQYSVAALIYMLLCGAPYADFAVERERMMQQIVELEPLPLADRNCFGESAAEEVLRRALAKDPGRRWPSMREFANALKSTIGWTLRPTANLAAVDRVLEWTASPSRDLRLRGVNAPVASVTYGAAGVACGLHRIAAARDDGELFARADAWAEFAASLAGAPDAFYETSIGIQPDTVGRVSPYHTLSGIELTRALIAHARGDLNALTQAIGAFSKASQERAENLDLTLGRGSTLMGMALIASSVGAHKELVDHGNALLASVWEELDTRPPIAECTDLDYLGMAHGWAGFLYFSLAWARAIGAEPHSGIPARLDELTKFAIVGPKGIAWPWSRRRRSESMPGWCNGNAGFLHLWILAHQMYGGGRFLHLAESTALEVADARHAGASLCCGAAGQAYALLRLYRHTGNLEWLNAARSLGEAAVEMVLRAEARHEPAMPLSLYKGELGVAVLLEDLRRPEFATMPLFECEAWPSPS